MMTVPDIIDALGGPTSVSRMIDKNPSTVSEMKRSGSIPVKYWPQIIRGAAGLGININNDTLAAAHTANTPAVPLESVEERESHAG